MAVVEIAKPEIKNDEVLLIDMDTLAVGNRIFELGSMYNAFIGFSEVDHEVVKRFQGFDFETSKTFWHKALELYLGTTNVSGQDLAAGAPQRIYRFQIFDGYTLLHDFVPVQASDGKLGLYDTFGDKGFRQVVDQSCATSGGAYAGGDSEWLEVERGSGAVYYIR